MKLIVDVLPIKIVNCARSPATSPGAGRKVGKVSLLPPQLRSCPHTVRLLPPLRYQQMRTLASVNARADDARPAG